MQVSKSVELYHLVHQTDLVECALRRPQPLNRRLVLITEREHLHMRAREHFGIDQPTIPRPDWN